MKKNKKNKNKDKNKLKVKFGKCKGRNNGWGSW